MIRFDDALSPTVPDDTLTPAPPKQPWSAGLDLGRNHLKVSVDRRGETDLILTLQAGDIGQVTPIPIPHGLVLELSAALRLADRQAQINRKPKEAA